MKDKIEYLGKSLIQHGKMNERVYLMKLHPDDFPAIITEINQLARKEQYTKIFCKIPAWASPGFLSDGFITEAIIPGFYEGKENAFFVSKFLNSDRLLGTEQEELKRFSSMLCEDIALNGVQLPETCHLKKLGHDEAEMVSQLYRKVFRSYPFPIHQSAYILKTMDNDVHYYGVMNGEKLVALSSAEVDRKGSNAEMTDFATDPDFRGKNLSVILLKEMERSMHSLGVRTLYTIARLNSPPMNKTFLKLGYEYAGTLIMNTHIAGRIESMNVLYKSIGHTKNEDFK